MWAHHAWSTPTTTFWAPTGVVGHRHGSWDRNSLSRCSELTDGCCPPLPTWSGTWSAGISQNLNVPLRSDGASGRCETTLSWTA